MLEDFSELQLAGLAVAGLVLLRCLAWLWRRNPPAVLSGRPRIIDGDTLKLRGERVRIAGIDAPELRQRFRGQIFGRGPGVLATVELRRMIAGQRIQVSPIKRDRYGRLIALVRAGEVDVGAEMIARGYAVAYATRNQRYRELERRAQAQGRGLWARDFERPADYRRRRRGSFLSGWRV